MSPRQNLVRGSLAALCLALGASVASTQVYTNEPFKRVVGFFACHATDNAARIVVC